MPIGKTTSRDIAERAGVSQATVSRALRDSPLVRPETRQRIREIAAELNYRVDRSAAGLRSRQSRTLALLIFEDPTTDDSQINPFFLAMIGSITRAAAAKNYDLLVSFQQMSEHWHLRYEASNRADGIILLGYGDYVSYGERLHALEDAGAHFVIWGPTVADQPGSSVGCNNELGGRLATQHLLTAGRQRIAFVGEASIHCPEFAARYRGYESALTDNALSADPTLCVDADNREAAGAAAVETLLASGADFDGIVAASDLMAIGAIKALQKAGRSVPADVAVVGFDDIPAASYVTPALTTVHQDTIRAGESLVSSVLNSIHGEPVQPMLLPPTLVVRESCGTSVATNGSISGIATEPSVATTQPLVRAVRQ
ncbi:MAG: LacI family DNA-binding transcriptional regulator [Pseudomonadota bacterium]